MAEDEVPGVGAVLPAGAEAERERLRARQAEALRENLRKRKEQQRARGKASEQSGESPTVPAEPKHIVDEEA